MPDASHAPMPICTSIRRSTAPGCSIASTRPSTRTRELHPLVRWQYRGGIGEEDRKAFLFTNVVDAKGRRYDLPVAVGAYAATAEIYRVGMNVATLAEIGPAWERAIANPIAPRLVHARRHARRS